MDRNFILIPAIMRLSFRFVFLFSSLFFLLPVHFKLNADPSFDFEKIVLPGYQEPNTPAQYNLTGYIRYFNKADTQKNKPILILISGFVSGTAWFEKMAQALIAKKNLEIWIVTRRQSFLEKRDLLQQDIAQCIQNPSLRDSLIQRIIRIENYGPSSFDFMKDWGFMVQMEDLKIIIEKAKKKSRSIFLGGWSDGVEYAMLYSHYRFADSKMGHQDLKGLVFLDEIPEWGKAQDYQSIISQQKKLIEQGAFFISYFPSLPIYSLALELANNKPAEKSSIASYFKIPSQFLKKGISNRATIGWIFDADIKNYNKNARSPFGYYLHSGDLIHKKNIIDWKEGELSDLKELIVSERKGQYLFEFFYPRKIILDYFTIGKCNFNCPQQNIIHDLNNQLPIFYALSGSNYMGQDQLDGIKWYLRKSGGSMQRVKVIRIYHYGHAEFFFAKEADKEFYQPLYQWIQKNL